MVEKAVNEQAKNYYEILEVSIDANEADIEKGYQRAKNAYSQDSVALYSIMTNEECCKMLEHIEEAYSILGDPIKRKLYDEARGINRQMPTIPNAGNTNMDNNGAHPEINSNNVIAMNSAPQAHQKKNINRIVASKKFSLDYTENAEMEKEIEQAGQFSGEFLKSIREYKNVDMVRMADMTKISKTYLMNIEEEAVDKLPALVYVRGFVYQYAKCLKLNPDLAATSYVYRIKKKREESA